MTAQTTRGGRGATIAACPSASESQPSAQTTAGEHGTGDQPTKGPFGTRTKSGGGKLALLLQSLAFGLPLDTILILAVYHFTEGTMTVRLANAFAQGLGPGLIFVAIGWVMFVDRNTISGVKQHYEQSVEATWQQRSERWGFFMMLLYNGCVMIAASLLPLFPLPRSLSSLPRPIFFVALFGWLIGTLAMFVVPTLLKWKENR